MIARFTTIALITISIRKLHRDQNMELWSYTLHSFWTTILTLFEISIMPSKIGIYENGEPYLIHPSCIYLFSCLYMFGINTSKTNIYKIYLIDPIFGAYLLEAIYE